MLKELERLVERVDSAERMAPAGSYEHGQYVQAALMSIWPRLRAAIRAELKVAAHGQATKDGT